MKTRKCKNCKDRFPLTRKDRVFCSTKCGVFFSKDKAVKEQEEAEKRVYCTKGGIIRLLKKRGKLQYVLDKSHIPLWVIEKYGVNDIQFKRMMIYAK